MTQRIETFHLSLVSHTNIGKTTLARTLLNRDIGVVADRAHVTEKAERFNLAKTDGAELCLWDTPGFGNSVSLARRLEERKNPIGWLMSEVWDRVANKSLWLNQKAYQHIKETSDVLLYLVNATDDPAQTDYIQAEMHILSWIEKPVIVLLNQMGEPKSDSEEAEEINRWKEALRPYSIVKNVLPMDAFVRCWVQEITLFDTIEEVLPAKRVQTYRKLRDTWLKNRQAAFAQSLNALCLYLDQLICDQEFGQSVSLLKNIRDRFKFGKSHSQNPTREMQERLSVRAQSRFYTLTDELLSANALDGSAIKKEIFKRLQSDWSVKTHVKPLGAAVAGAIGSGAIGGFAADLSTGGMSLGVGTMIGGIIGALSGAGLAHTFNIRNDAKEGSVVKWSDKAVTDFATEAILLYLAIAHFGRGRGKWNESEYPKTWRPLVQKTIENQTIDRRHLTLAITSVIRNVLAELYPNSNF